MNKRILEILTFVMKEIRDNTLDDIDLQFIIDMLSDHGFSEDEITTAMSWIMDHGENIDRIIQGQTSGVPRPIWRHLNEIERSVISPTAFSYLFHLRELEVVSDNEMEAIIDRAVKLSMPQIDVEDMQDLIALVVLDIENSAPNGYFQFTSTRLPH